MLIILISVVIALFKMIHLLKWYTYYIKRCTNTCESFSERKPNRDDWAAAAKLVPEASHWKRSIGRERAKEKEAAAQEATRSAHLAQDAVVGKPIVVEAVVVPFFIWGNKSQRAWK